LLVTLIDTIPGYWPLSGTTHNATNFSEERFSDRWVILWKNWIKSNMERILDIKHISRSEITSLIPGTLRNQSMRPLLGAPVPLKLILSDDEKAIRTAADRKLKLRGELPEAMPRCSRSPRPCFQYRLRRHFLKLAVQIW
jgi:hypothetical protein